MNQKLFRSLAHGDDFEAVGQRYQWGCWHSLPPPAKCSLWSLTGSLKFTNTSPESWESQLYTVVNTRSEATGQQLPSIIDRQVQLEAVKPPHRRFAPFGIQRKNPVLGNPLGITDLQRG